MADTTPSYNINTLQGDVNRLRDLIGVTADLFIELDDGWELPDGQRNVGLDRIASLVRVGRDLADGIAGKIDSNYAVLKRGQS